MNQKMMMRYFLLAAACAAAAADPRYQRDPRCPPAAAADPPTQLRFAASRVFYSTPLPANATLADCGYACCGDWSCVAFALEAAGAEGPLAGLWTNHDSLRNESQLTLEQRGAALHATSLDPAKAGWTAADGLLAADGQTLFLSFDGSARNNRSGVVSGGGSVITLERLPFDPQNFTQVFTLVSRANASSVPLCHFMDEVPPLQARSPASFLASGVRAALPPAFPPPFPQSTFIAATVDATALLGLMGDEFPTTWASDGLQYTGAGDNAQPGLPPSPPIPYIWSPASFFIVNASSPLDAAYPSQAFALQGGNFPLSEMDPALALCPPWKKGIANIKSSGVIEFGGTMFWAVSCFNYGDDPTFNRQRYGPAWIASSTNMGLNWTSSPRELFSGRLAAPRFVQAGMGNAGAPDPSHIYALFPGTQDNTSFFECNDGAWLGRAPANASLLPATASWEYFVGLSEGGEAQWDADSSVAVGVLDWPLHTSVQQVNWHAALGRFVLANWVWVSLDGYPRPDHSPDQAHARTARQRTWLTLLEAPNLWGPWSIFYSDSNWQYSDGSSGAYTPVFPPAWINATDDSMWMVSTQCCNGATLFPPDNHYSFNAQKVTIKRL